MKNEAYYYEMRTLLTAFNNAFDDIEIKRINYKNKAIQKVKVRTVEAPKQRVLLDMVDKAQNRQLPVIAFHPTSMVRDETRTFNKLDGSQYEIEDFEPEYRRLHPQPVAVNITINMDILAAFQEDMDQILSNFIPYVDPYFMISYKNPYIKDDLLSLSENPSLSSTVTYSHQEIRSKVLWNNNITFTYPIDLDEGKKYHVAANTSFTIEGWLFKEKRDPVGKIYKINQNFINGTVGDVGESELLSLSAIPQVDYVYPFQINETYPGTIAIQGKMMQNVGSVYLSGSPNIFGPLSSYNPFGSLSGEDYWHNNGFDTAFSGVSADFEYINDNLIQVSLPNILDIGKFDIILVDDLNGSGYTKMTQSLAKNTYLHYNYPALSGIEIV